MPRFTVEVETEETPPEEFIEALADPKVQEALPAFTDARLLSSSTVVRMNGELVMTGDIPDHVDPNGLMVRFVLDKRELERVWLDVHWLPRVGDFVHLDRLDASDGVGIVRGVGWVEHNFVLVYLDTWTGKAAAEGDDD